MVSASSAISMCVAHGPADDFASIDIESNAGATVDVSLSCRDSPRPRGSQPLSTRPRTNCCIRRNGARVNTDPRHECLRGIVRTAAKALKCSRMPDTRQLALNAYPPLPSCNAANIAPGKYRLKGGRRKLSAHLFGGMSEGNQLPSAGHESAIA